MFHGMRRMKRADRRGNRTVQAAVELSDRRRRGRPCGPLDIARAVADLVVLIGPRDAAITCDVYGPTRSRAFPGAAAATPGAPCWHTARDSRSWLTGTMKRLNAVARTWRVHGSRRVAEGRRPSPRERGRK